jgi:hypothetical protein
VDPGPPDERNRLILRRTLSAVAWITALWSAVIGLLQVQLGWPGGWLAAGHAVLLGLAGFGLWRPRVWGWGATALAALGSLLFVARDLKSGNVQAALVDGAFAAVALGIFLAARVRRLDKSPSGGQNP